MTARIALAAAALALATACSPPGPPPPPPPAMETLFVGGAIRTGRAEAPLAEAVGVADGRITFVGAETQARGYATEDTLVVDLKGDALFPGFVDAHVHLLDVGRVESVLDLSDVASIAELVEVVGAAAARAGSGETLYGRGWNEAEWPEGRFPTHEDLDPVSQTVSVVLERVDGHALLLNSFAMLNVWITGPMQDPPGGRYETFDDGFPTGLLIDAAMERAAGLLRAPEGQARDDALARGAAVMAGRGWTGVHNMSVPWTDIARIEALAEAETIEIRVYNAVEQAGAAQLFASGPRAAANDRIITRALKLYMDGALGSRGAALNAPYADAPDISGVLRLERDDAISLFDKALRAGLQMCVHAIGDRANGLVLDWMGDAMDAAPVAERAVADPRWRIEHAQILDRRDIPRFAQLGVIASMQPSHFATDQHFAPRRLGADRLAGAYAWKSLVEAGATLVGGSDAPVETGDPVEEFYVAAARRGLDGRREAPFDGGEALTREEALALFTLNPAIASFQEDDLGTIEVGKKADFTAFSADLMTAPLEDIPDARATMTVVDGQIIYWASAN